MTRLSGQLIVASLIQSDPPSSTQLFWYLHFMSLFCPLLALRMMASSRCLTKNRFWFTTRTACVSLKHLLQSGSGVGTCTTYLNVSVVPMSPQQKPTLITLCLTEITHSVISDSNISNNCFNRLPFTCQWCMRLLSRNAMFVYREGCITLLSPPVLHTKLLPWGMSFNRTFVLLRFCLGRGIIYGLHLLMTTQKKR